MKEDFSVRRWIKRDRGAKRRCTYVGGGNDRDNINEESDVYDDCPSFLLPPPPQAQRVLNESGSLSVLQEFIGGIDPSVSLTGHSPPLSCARGDGGQDLP